MSKLILCLDFDGVLHSYTSGWQGVDQIPDPPVEGAMEFLKTALESFDVQVYSSRSENQEHGIRAMQDWLLTNMLLELPFQHFEIKELFDSIKWPTTKPPAFVTIDDRAIQFTGEWPSVETLLAFKPWNKVENTFLEPVP